MRDIVLDLPPPISVNKMRRFDFAASQQVREWKRGADAFVYQAKVNKENPLRFNRVTKFEIDIVLHDDHVRCDADNAAKCVIDYLRSLGVIENDAPRNMRKVTIRWGHAPAGVRVTVKPLSIESMDEVLQLAEARAR